jgi:UDP-N-acetylmuramoyl-tripeptide--D-alanyl-D-alanine ligase
LYRLGVRLLAVSGSVSSTDDHLLRSEIVLAFKITLQTLAKVTGGALKVTETDNPAQIWGDRICTDTRSLQPNEWFLALSGEHFDGHHFIQQALDRSAAGVIVEQAVEAVPQLRVENTLTAYQAIAHWWRQELNIPIVAITRSVGKTTTKELIAAALATQGGAVGKTRANFNNEIGVPKTLLELDESHRYGVIEMGMRGPGQIQLLAQIAQPDIAVITNVGTAHIELLGSEQAIADAKCELLAALDPAGIAILNHDNPRLLATARQVWSGQQMTYGLEGGDIQGKLLDAGHIEVDGVTLPLPLPGQHNAVNFLAAIAVMTALGLDWRTLRTGLTVALPSGRAARITLPQDVIVLDETYNAGVESMKAALQLLKETPGQRHIAVLGTMKELGAHTAALHEAVGQVVAELKLDYLLTLADADAAAALAKGAHGVPTVAFEDANPLLARLLSLWQPGDRFLFKASRAVALDQVVDQLKQALSDDEAGALP